MGLLFGETNAYPFRESELVTVRQVGTNCVRTEIETTRSLIGWEQYADLQLLAWYIAEENEGNNSAARQHWDAAIRMWDGNGFLDAAASDGRYATYKLGLALIAANRLQRIVTLPKGLLNKLLELQDSSGGWITDYNAKGETIGVANVETTCLCILGITPRWPEKQDDLIWN